MPEGRTEPDVASKQPVNLPNSKSFRSLGNTAPNAARSQRVRRLEPPKSSLDTSKFESYLRPNHTKGTPKRVKPVILGSNSPQPLGPPSQNQTGRSQSHHSRTNHDHNGSPNAPKHPRVHPTNQSTPPRARHGSTRQTRPTADLPPGSLTAPINPAGRVAEAPRVAGERRLMKLDCTINGQATSVQCSTQSREFALGNQWFRWADSQFTYAKVDSSGNRWVFRLNHRSRPSVAFILEYEDMLRFKAACGQHEALAVQTGDHSPPETRKKVPTEPPPLSEPGVQLKVCVKGSDDTTAIMNEQGFQLHSKMHEQLPWPLLELGQAPSDDTGTHYVLRYGAERLDVFFRPKDVPIVRDSILKFKFEGHPPPPLSAVPNAASSPKVAREGHLESTPQKPASTATLSEEEKRERLRKLRCQLPNASPRHIQRATSVPDAGDGIPPQEFYGAELRGERERSQAPGKDAPGKDAPSKDAPSKDEPGKDETGASEDYINLTSPEKPERRARRRTRATAEDLVDGDAPVEPTDEDFALLRSDGFHRVMYRFWDGRLMEVSVEDIARLNPRIYVNDNIIWFFLRQYLERLRARDRATFDKVLLLNTFFYPELRKGAPPKWITKVPILERHVTVMPIHESAHWSVAVIIGLDKAVQRRDDLTTAAVAAGASASQPAPTESSTPKPAVVILDSLGPAQNYLSFRKVVSVLRGVLKMHGIEHFKRGDFRGLRTTVPVQTNHTDCGVYLLHYVEQIFDRPDEFLARVEAAPDRVLEMGDFWREAELETKREDLKRNLKRLGSAEHSAEHDGGLDVGAGSGSESDEIEVVGMEEVRKRRKTGPGRESQATASPPPQQASPKTPQPRSGMSQPPKHPKPSKVQNLHDFQDSTRDERGVIDLFKSEVIEISDGPGVVVARPLS